LRCAGDARANMRAGLRGVASAVGPRLKASWRRRGVFLQILDRCSRAVQDCWAGSSGPSPGKARLASAMPAWGNRKGLVASSTSRSSACCWLRRLDDSDAAGPSSCRTSPRSISDVAWAAGHSGSVRTLASAVISERPRFFHTHEQRPRVRAVVAPTAIGHERARKLCPQGGSVPERGN
jgi:hypothetical protein